MELRSRLPQPNSLRDSDHFSNLSILTEPQMVSNKEATEREDYL